MFLIWPVLNFVTTCLVTLNIELFGPGIGANAAQPNHFHRPRHPASNNCVTASL
jgi:hypothetical protein